ncbi:hypothetical protein CVT26_011816 [Gymnopilus dilepis]|uniref:Uncharacterized protein n=1 Tax=Gymnopilus dilepis TaxID=231916 RepID=A0A409X6R9_9AGAR|nr:hypothetical protein CVT26_011816 [Gymnopilus dilepis]
MDKQKPYARAAWIYFTKNVSIFRDHSIPMQWHDDLRPRTHLNHSKRRAGTPSLAHAVKTQDTPSAYCRPTEEQSFDHKVESYGAALLPLGHDQSDSAPRLQGLEFDHGDLPRRETSVIRENEPPEWSMNVDDRASTHYSGSIAAARHLAPPMEQGASVQSQEGLEAGHPVKQPRRVALVDFNDQTMLLPAKRKAEEEPHLMKPSTKSRLLSENVRPSTKGSSESLFTPVGTITISDLPPSSPISKPMRKSTMAQKADSQSSFVGSRARDPSLTLEVKVHPNVSSGTSNSLRIVLPESPSRVRKTDGVESVSIPPDLSSASNDVSPLPSRSASGSSSSARKSTVDTLPPLEITPPMNESEQDEFQGTSGELSIPQSMCNSDNPDLSPQTFKIAPETSGSKPDDLLRIHSVESAERVGLSALPSPPLPPGGDVAALSGPSSCAKSRAIGVAGDASNEERTSRVRSSAELLAEFAKAAPTLTSNVPGQIHFSLVQRKGMSMSL